MKATPALCIDYKLHDGTYPVNIRVSFRTNGISRYKNIPLFIRVKKTDWNFKLCRVRADHFPNGIKMNRKISDIMNMAEGKILDGVSPGELIKAIRAAADPNSTSIPSQQSMTSKKPTIDAYFKEYIKLCREGKILHHKTKQPLSNHYILSIGTAATRLGKFNEDCRKGKLDWTDIGDEFYNEFVSHMRFKYKFKKDAETSGIKENSIGATIKRMILVFKRAAKKDKLLDADVLDEFTIITQDVDTIALSEDDIQMVIDADLSKTPHLERERKRFLIAYNFLLRFGDSVSVDKKHIIQEGGKYYFRMTTQKTKEPVYIPIMPIVYDILNTEGFKMGTSINQSSNKNIKKLCNAAGITSDYLLTEFIKGKKVETVYKKFELTTTHTTRRSAATNLFLAGMDLDSIRQFGGWRTIQQVMDYIKVEKIQNARRQVDHPFFGLK